MSLEQEGFKPKLVGEILPEIASELSGIVGKDISIEIDWDSFDTEEGISEIQHQVFGRVIDATKQLMEDQTRKAIFSERFKAVKVTNIASKDDRCISFIEGTLNVQSAWTEKYFSPREIALMIKLALID